MFYLISAKDGLINEEMLVNALNLKSIDVVTGNKVNYNVLFCHNNSNNTFSFSPENIFNVSEVMENICELTTPQFVNPFILVTDSENINSIKQRFGASSDIINKASHILINIHDIEIVYETDKKYYISANNRKFCIKESPQEVLNIINSKMLKQENPIEVKNQWKKNL